MKISIATLLLVMAIPSAMASETEWKYKGEKGTEHWAELSDEFSLCESGVNQSPIDITSVLDAQLPPLILNYQGGPAEKINNGHTIQVNIKGHNTFVNDSGTFDLLQFHFHAPSENTIDGKSFPLEAHFVHADKEGRLAVIGVMFTLGKNNPQLQKVWDNMDQKGHSKSVLIKELAKVKLLPKEKAYYRFNGSLTTPPCTEGVRWFVLKDTIEASQAQIDKFHQIMGTDNNRPIQPINARVILE